MTRRKIPNLFVIGAAKCATTSVHSYLARHPDIFMSYLKEPSYFADPEDKQFHKWAFHEPEGVRLRWYRNDLESYLGLFAQAGDSKIVGESSTSYTDLPKTKGVAKRIHDFNPHARLLYLMRDPIERTISHYWWLVQCGSETRDMYSAIAAEDPYYREVSNYVMQLEPYYDLFDRTQIFCGTVEELMARPEKFLRTIFTWLDVDASFVPANLQERLNARPEVMIQPKNNLFSFFRNTRLWNAIGPFAPRSLRSLGRALAERRIYPNVASEKGVREFLRPLHLAQVEKLSRLLNRDFPEWKSLYANETIAAVFDAKEC